jgi:hypothetical protein
MSKWSIAYGAGNPQEEEWRWHEGVPIGIDLLFAFEYRNVVL